MRHDREELLRKYMAVAPGLAVKEAVEQSSCLIFRDGRVITFNDEIACSAECEMGFEGAVAAKPFIDLLSKLAEKEVDVSVNGSEVIIKGKRRRAGIAFEAEIKLPVSVVTPPEKWREIDTDFTDAIGVVQHCAGKDPNNFMLMCINITPEHVEACDNYQVIRYPVHTGVRNRCLVKRDSIKYIAGLGMTEVSETKTWLHFRNPSELVFSVRREDHEFTDLTSILATEGEPTTLPGGLAEVVAKAEVFSSQNADENLITLKLKPGRLLIRAQGVNGWYEEMKEIKWTGERMEFTIDPKLLLEIVSRTNDCIIAPGKLKVDGGKFIYVTCLGRVDKDGNPEKTATEKED